MTTVSEPAVVLGVWTILDDASETVQATITREREVYAVRDARGRVLGRYPTARQALASIAA
ncbi:MAG TPA: hypothetical protein VFQ74_09935 [Pseudolysinimonas sp.]|nr:hypothetical protein [Pseudolysinimonas sp.]